MYGINNLDIKPHFLKAKYLLIKQLRMITKIVKKTFDIKSEICIKLNNMKKPKISSNIVKERPPINLKNSGKFTVDLKTKIEFVKYAKRIAPIIAIIFETFSSTWQILTNK